jgi:hypothetical protein
MKSKKLYQVASIAALLCLAHSVSAQDSHWVGPTTDDLWSNANNWNPVGVPPPGNPITAYAGNVWLQPVGGVPVTITIGAGDVETPGVGNSVEDYNTIFGPESGCTLNIYGSLSFDWTIVPWQTDPTPGRRSHINMYAGSSMSTTGASLNLGDGWWPQLRAGPYETVNLYGNASYGSLGGAGLWLGGHLNIYDTANFRVNGYVNMDVLPESSQANNDATRFINVGGGTLVLPISFSTTVTNWIDRGVLRAYGKGYDYTDFVITDDGITNTFVTVVPLGGALQRVYLQPLARASVTVGTFQQSTLVGDYPSVGGVLLSSSEPGVDPATITAPVYTSSNIKVATVDANGLVTAVGEGTAQITATVGAFNSTNHVTLTVVPNTPVLAHRYSFTTDASDSVGGANGTLNGDASISGGAVVLTGNTNAISGGYSSVHLPAGILSGLDEVTIETWATFPGAISSWANLFAFGETITDPLDSNLGTGGNYVTFCPHTGGSTLQATFGQDAPGFFAERDAFTGSVLDSMANVHIVAVYRPLAGQVAVYTNGVLAATVSIFNTLTDPIAAQDPAFTNHSILSYTLGTDPNNYIGQSLYWADPGLVANIDEFRIYNGPLSAAQIAADYALGPNQILGTSLTTSLSASLSGSNVVLKWPTTSALVTLLSSPTLGAGAVWTSVTAPLTVVGGNYEVTVPATGTLFFRLQQ